jgi:ATP-dependent DNA helicase RecQ
VLDALGDEPVSVAELERAVDLRRTRLETVLKILDVDGAVERADRGWVRTGRPWDYDHDRVARIEAARAAEAEAMVAYAAGDACLMAFLRTELDDPDAATCGRCAVCTGNEDPVELDPAVVRAAVEFLRTVDVVLEPRKQWPRGLPEPKGNIKPAQRAEEGRALCRVDDAGWWPAVAEAMATGAVTDELVDGIARALKRWPWADRPTWVTWIPSNANESFLATVAARIGALGKLDVVPVITRTRTGRPQAAVENSAHRLANVWGAFAVDPVRHRGPVLVLDDFSDSGWTMTVVAALLREAGADAVLPFVLARR